MQYRNEVKHMISPLDKAVLLSRLTRVMQRDSHTDEDGRYRVRSLYFDNVYDRALRDKQNGVSRREKFRIRYYDGDTSRIHLEKKVRQGGVGYKVSEAVTKDEAQRIVDGDVRWMALSGRPLLIELYARMKGEGLKPSTIVDYTRTPFVYAPGNVRVTIDENIRTGLKCTDFLNPDAVTVPVGPDIVLEVKWDAFLPSCVRSAVRLQGVRATAFSKYAVCRKFD